MDGCIYLLAMRSMTLHSTVGTVSDLENNWASFSAHTCLFSYELLFCFCFVFLRLFRLHIDGVYHPVLYNVGNSEVFFDRGINRLIKRTSLLFGFGCSACNPKKSGMALLLVSPYPTLTLSLESRNYLSSWQCV